MHVKASLTITDAQELMWGWHNLDANTCLYITITLVSMSFSYFEVSIIDKLSN